MSFGLRPLLGLRPSVKPEEVYHSLCVISQRLDKQPRYLRLVLRPHRETFGSALGVALLELACVSRDLGWVA